MSLEDVKHIGIASDGLLDSVHDVPIDDSIQAIVDKVKAGKTIEQIVFDGAVPQSRFENDQVREALVGAKILKEDAPGEFRLAPGIDLKEKETLIREIAGANYDKIASILSELHSPTIQNIDNRTLLLWNPPAANEAMLTPEQRNNKTGGIDLNANKEALQVKHSAEGSIEFKSDAAMLKEIELSPGLNVNIIDMRPANNVREFLGLS